ncbi:hypothetical protein LINGRAHAP2_LOCUS19677 [Linum grandiflorum]
MEGNEVVHLEIGFKFLHRPIRLLQNGMENFEKIKKIRTESHT